MRLSVATNRPCTLTVSQEEMDQLFADIAAKRPLSLDPEVIEHLKAHNHVTDPMLGLAFARLVGVDVFVEGAREPERV